MATKRVRIAVTEGMPDPKLIRREQERARTAAVRYLRRVAKVMPEKADRDRYREAAHLVAEMALPCEEPCKECNSRGIYGLGLCRLCSGTGRVLSGQDRPTAIQSPASVKERR